MVNIKSLVLCGLFAVNTAHAVAVSPSSRPQHYDGQNQLVSEVGRLPFNVDKCHEIDLKQDKKDTPGRPGRMSHAEQLLHARSDDDEERDAEDGEETYDDAAGGLGEGEIVSVIGLLATPTVCRLSNAGF